MYVFVNYRRDTSSNYNKIAEYSQVIEICTAWHKKFGRLQDSKNYLKLNANFISHYSHFK